VRYPTAGLLAMVLTLAGCTFAPPPPPSAPDDHDVDWPVGDFRLTERSGRTVTRDDLRGRVWVASFIFTRCTSICPRVTATVAQLQEDLGPQDDVRFVSFSVEPQHDTPAVLERYAKSYHADAERWLFLTGPQETIYALIEKSFHDVARQNRGTERTPGNEVMHSGRLFVVDRHGRIRWYCDSADGDRVPRLRHKVLQLVREQP
jgi:cytochrome oxidase Cu insertion factor (SCO1/SenC/PrrC family)